MWKYSFIFFVSFIIFISCSVHKITVPEQIGASSPERYDFNATKGGKEAKVILHRRWVTEWRPMTAEGGVCYEYAPAKDFYKIVKHYYRNGMIKMRGKILGSARFGIWEYFDEEGNRTRVVNEDAKFGDIGPREIIKLLETEGWIDRRIGKNNIYRYYTKLPINGFFYKELEPNLRIIFNPGAEEGNQLKSPQWHIWIVLPVGFMDINIYEKRYMNYYIDGCSGTFEKRGVPFIPFGKKAIIVPYRYLNYSLDTIIVSKERYDFISTAGGTCTSTEESNGWLIEKHPMTPKGAVYYEYSPAKEFHKRVKYFYPNGMIRERGRMIGSIRFGPWELFDEQGNRIQIINEKVYDGFWTSLIQLLEYEELVNLDTGETKILPYRSPLKTDGSLYKTLEPWLEIKIAGYQLISTEWNGNFSSSPINEEEISEREKRLQEKQKQEDLLVKEMVESGVPVILEEDPMAPTETIQPIINIDVKTILDGFDMDTYYELRSVRNSIKIEKLIRTDRLVSE